MQFLKKSHLNQLLAYGAASDVEGYNTYVEGLTTDQQAELVALIMQGEGRYEDTFDEMVKQFRRSGNVAFRARVPFSVLPDLIKKGLQSIGE